MMTVWCRLGHFLSGGAAEALGKSSGVSSVTVLAVLIELHIEALPETEHPTRQT